MKTWEMIKGLMENPKLKFKYNTGSESGVVANINGGIKIIECSSIPSNTDTLRLHHGFMKLDWEPVHEPVDFMTAINSGKDIRYDNWNTFNTISATLSILSDKVLSTALRMIQGKWYIE